MATRFAEVRLALERHEACCPMGSWPRDLPRWSHQLPKAMRGLVSTLAFDDFRARFASPTTETALATSGFGALGEWSQGYRERLSLLMDCARAQFVTRDRRNLAAIFEQIDGYGCEGPSGFSLAQRALAWQLTRRCAPTVSLVGMRRPSYVDEVLALAEHPFAVDGGGLRKGET